MQVFREIENNASDMQFFFGGGEGVQIKFIMGNVKVVNRFVQICFIANRST